MHGNVAHTGRLLQQKRVGVLMWSVIAADFESMARSAFSWASIANKSHPRSYSDWCRFARELLQFSVKRALRSPSLSPCGTFFWIISAFKGFSANWSSIGAVLTLNGCFLRPIFVQWTTMCSKSLSARHSDQLFLKYLKLWACDPQNWTSFRVTASRGNFQKGRQIQCNSTRLSQFLNFDTHLTIMTGQNVQRRLHREVTQG